MEKFKVGTVEVEVGGDTSKFRPADGRAHEGEGTGTLDASADQGQGSSTSSGEEGRVHALVGKIGARFCSLKQKGQSLAAFRELELDIAGNLPTLVGGHILDLDTAIKLLMDIEKFSKEYSKGGENQDATPLDMFQKWLGSDTPTGGTDEEQAGYIPTPSPAEPPKRKRGRPPKEKHLDTPN